MCTQSELIKILEVFARSVKKEIGSKLSDIILFGSYARGDYDEESDVDVAVIVDVPQGEEHIYYKQLTKIIGDIDEQFNYTVLLAPVVISNKMYETWKDDLPFYKNIQKEGVRIVA